jgi:hypothetical protein
VSLFESLNLIALEGAVKPDGLSTMRYVMRWYSKTFHTPLHVVVNQVPMEDVWLAFYEEKYQGLSREELQEFIDLAMETPEEREARLIREAQDEISEASFMKMTEEAAKKQAEKKAETVDPASLLSQVPVMNKPLPQASLPDIPVEPDIEIEFINPTSMDQMLEGDFLGIKSK